MVVAERAAEPPPIESNDVASSSKPIIVPFGTRLPFAAHPATAAAIARQAPVRRRLREWLILARG